MKIQFLGAAEEVTGSKHLITTDSGKHILLDCGMYQGKGMETDAANRDLGFDPTKIDHIILTHAHIDHSGLVPYVYRLGCCTFAANLINIIWRELFPVFARQGICTWVIISVQ